MGIFTKSAGMQTRMIQRITSSSFLLSLLLHLIILFFIILAMFNQPQDEEHKKTPKLYIPSYIYTGAITPSSRPSRASTATSKASRPAAARQPAQPREAEDTVMPEQNQELALAPPARHPAQSKPKNIQRTEPASTPGSLLAASFDALKQTQMQEISKDMNDEEPILMIGDENTPADPLIKLLGRSLSAHFSYPEMEGRMGIKGRVMIRMTLHPEGTFSDVVLVKSSDNDNLDAAALYAVNTAPRVVGADNFMSRPKRFLVGFVFY